MRPQSGSGALWLALLLAGAESSAQIGTPAPAAAAPNAAFCSALSSLVLPEMAGLNADWIEPAPDRGPGQSGATDRPLPAHCRVRAIVEPTIRIELWLPAPADWNGRFLGIGGGGFAGSIATARMGEALAAGYASASTDTGHAADTYDWLADDGLLRDFGYRAIFEMTAKSRALLAAFYGRPADYRYFTGCSLGGRQGLMEAQRFPEDYDGIVAGAPVNAFIDTRTTQLWATRIAQPVRGQSLLSDADLALVSSAATAQCDALDGALDGVLEDPRRCNFDPARLQCGTGSAGRCLTPAQVSAVRSIHAGPGFPLPLPGFAIGSEYEWSFATNGTLSALTLEFFRRAIFHDMTWDWRSFDLQIDYMRAQDEAGWMLDAISPDLSRFRNSGGKLILYHGWNDSNNSPEATIAYYSAVERTLAGSGSFAAETRDFARLFMVPGMGHCGGGIGTSTFDTQRAIEDWVERGIAPDRIEAERTEDDELIRTRPLCPYPQTARYSGRGDTNLSGSFRCEF